MLDITQELMSPQEAARWFRRSPSWLRQQDALLRLGRRAAAPLFHIAVCRAYTLGLLCNLAGEDLRRLQMQALAVACGVPLPGLTPTAHEPIDAYLAAPSAHGKAPDPSVELTGALVSGALPPSQSRPTFRANPARRPSADRRRTPQRPARSPLASGTP